jgi:hypothetical protein
MLIQHHINDAVPYHKINAKQTSAEKIQILETEVLAET